MDTTALQLECRFSLPPNSLGYCGKNTAAAKFKKCLTTGNCRRVKAEVRHFIVLYPYLKTLAQISGLPVFSYQVIESYWLGNELLNQTKPEHYNLLLKNFLRQGVPTSFVDELKENRPPVFIPNHLFQVLFVGVGKASGAVPFNLESINHCMIRWGRVEKIGRNNATVNLNSLEKAGRFYRLTKLREVISFSNDLTPQLKTGDTVSVHWQQINKILTAEEVKKLSFWTKKVLRSLSEGGKTKQAHSQKYQ